jgi:hypothetical protein
MTFSTHKQAKQLLVGILSRPTDVKFLQGASSVVIKCHLNIDQESTFKWIDIIVADAKQQIKELNGDVEEIECTTLLQLPNINMESFTKHTSIKEAVECAFNYAVEYCLPMNLWADLIRQLAEGEDITRGKKFNHFDSGSNNGHVRLAIRYIKPKGY